MNKLYLPQYNLRSTLLGGQAFRWAYIDDHYYGVVKDQVIKILQEGEYIYWQTYPNSDNFELLRSYLRLDVDYEDIINQISKDSHIKKALEHHPHLRLLKQDFEETVISFIISANSNIPKIKRSINLLSQQLGDKYNLDGKDFYLFPKIEKIAETSIDDLRKTGIGYRAPYIKKSSQMLIDNKYELKLNKNLNSTRQNLDIKLVKQDSNQKSLKEVIADLDYKEAKQQLMELHGIGNKVADCILVFSLSFDHVTPLDLWAQRALTNLYDLDPKTKYLDMMNWITNYFGNNTSWAGQFLFEYIRNNPLANTRK